MSTVRIEPSWCVGSGYCAAAAATIFILGDDDVVHLHGLGADATERDVPADQIDATRAAAAACPAGAIDLDITPSQP
ncbi:ferredoxin [Mycobacterium sp. CBMA293]|uniref:ferredoxin n=1 Tax=unclassified Mycolicibacterium TaxID=2636767 RepID=UPI0012DD3756|nr:MULTISPECIES: ferredoxin [unclassified Mycolicibacterium]MUL47409.1 ferredoxin [Mycolicibacterium sp. CBMA 360]MUL59394.1 ferredoxin [Mycolicibacterium sp. CBMA 335]MUL71119.1 ferredoxin [Mycolicibacterium sp. CBMA 311]MUL94762.1 ferredoxin [Mycolicibacterium sp. CBMA 230]MUM03603.1 hypothetical protein [Mycolicibacterium sp. CBMA 213]